MCIVIISWFNIKHHPHDDDPNRRMWRTWCLFWVLLWSLYAFFLISWYISSSFSLNINPSIYLLPPKKRMLRIMMKMLMVMMIINMIQLLLWLKSRWISISIRWALLSSPSHIIFYYHYTPDVNNIPSLHPNLYSFHLIFNDHHEWEWWFSLFWELFSSYESLFIISSTTPDNLFQEQTSESSLETKVKIVTWHNGFLTQKKVLNIYNKT